MRTDLVVNATAATLRRRPAILRELAARSAGQAELVVTHSLGDLERACEAIARRGSDLVVLCGGDGSHMAGVSALAHAFGARTLPRIALAPGGTACTVAKRWGQTGDVLGYVGAVLDATLAPGGPSTVRRPTLRVKEHGGVERVGFIFGTGLVAGFFEEYYAQGARGYAGAARIVLRIFVGSLWGSRFAREILDPMPLVLEVDGRELEPRAFSLVTSAVIRDLGLHMCVTHRGGEDPFRLHLVASSLPATELGPRAPRVVAGRSIGGVGGFDGLVHRFTVRFPEATGDGPYVLDGDLLRARAVTVEPGPGLDVVTIRA